jgi:hypothetical protein
MNSELKFNPLIMEKFDITSEIIKVQTTFVSGKKLATLLGVSTAAVSDAIKHDNHCGGQPICEWAEFYDSGRVKGYRVPNHLYDELTGKQQGSDQQQEDKGNRGNPASVKLNSADSKQNSVDEAPKEQGNVNQHPSSVTHVNKSVFPKDQDYMQTAGMVSLPLVLKKALDKDTTQSRVVITATSGAIGAIIGGAATESAVGALVGTGLGLGSAWLTYLFVDRKTQTGLQPEPQKQLPQQVQESSYMRGAKPLEYDYV